MTTQSRKIEAGNQKIHKIVDITLDSHSLVMRSADLEIERHKAISDLLHENSFRLKEPDNAQGPYRLMLSLEDERLILHIACTKTGHQENLRILLAPMKQHISDYAIVCDNFYKTARAGQIHRLEAIDAGRRSIHDEAAGLLAENLENKVILDKMTARRLFSLLYVLHMRNAPNI